MILEFKGGTDGVPVFICPDAVSWIQPDAVPVEDGSYLIVIGTVDGKEHRVQGELSHIVSSIQEQRT
jgi:hypothetical protein